MSVKLAARLPKGDNNGLTAPKLVSQLIADDGDSYHVAVVLLKRRKIEKDDESGCVTATCGIVRIEPVIEANAAAALQAQMCRLYETRVGRSPLPIPGLDADAEVPDDPASAATVRRIRPGGDR